MILPEGMKQAILAMESGEWEVEQSGNWPNIIVEGKKLEQVGSIPGYALWLWSYKTCLWFSVGGRDHTFTKHTVTTHTITAMCSALGIGPPQEVPPKLFEDMANKGFEAYLKKRVIG
jgi:hypothetical protein